MSVGPPAVPLADCWQPPGLPVRRPGPGPPAPAALETALHRGRLAASRLWPVWRGWGPRSALWTETDHVLGICSLFFN